MGWDPQGKVDNGKLQIKIDETYHVVIGLFCDGP